MSVDRGSVWARLGAPTDQEGSVNDPRTHEEHGLKWNERWVYRSQHGEAVERVVRVVLWNRYDFLGVFRVEPDGSLQSEPLPGA